MTSFNYSLIELPYHSNLIQHYAKLASLPGFVLLDSSDVSRGRYDIVTACPYERYYCSDYTQINDYLAQLQKAVPKALTLATELPFQGGLIGYFSYDFGAALKGLTIPSSTALNRAESCLADFGLYDWAIITDHHLKKVSLFAANQHTDTKTVLKEVLERWQSTTIPSNPITHVSPFKPLITEAAYYKSFEKIWDALYQGRCYQVNYTQPFLAEYDGDLWSVYEKIRAQNPVPFSAFLRGTQQDLLSFSPERFLTYDDRKLLTSPIKGTILRDVDEARDACLRHQLMTCEKNRAENTMIVDLLRNDLSQISEAGSVKVTALCELETYRSVHHLVSTMVATCRENISPIAAFLSCFPGGSITGAPKLEAMRVIYEQEPFARGAYCGSMVYFSAHGRFDSNILIRTLLAQDGQLSLSAGGGLVIDSKSEEEYAECLVKIKSLRRALEVF